MNAADCRRALLLTEGSLGVFTSKTAVSILRYRRDDVVAVVDSVHAGRPIESVLGFGEGVPIVADVASALPWRPDALLIGTAPSGGQLADRMRRHVADALRAGLTVVSGLHVRLRDDREFTSLADAHGARIVDARDPGVMTRVSFGKARGLRVRRVLTVGTDCVVGKMVTCLELCAAAKRVGLDAAFVPTGQTGIMIAGWGTAIDAVVSDFAGGAVEALIEHVADRPLCFIEGQGSIEHPGYSGVTLSLLHGSCPDAMILCHHPGRRVHNGYEDCPIAPIEEQIALNEALTRPIHPAKVIAVAINTAGMSDAEAARHAAELGKRTGLPVADPIRHGCDALLAAVRSHLTI